MNSEPPTAILKQTVDPSHFNLQPFPKEKKQYPRAPAPYSAHRSDIIELRSEFLKQLIYKTNVTNLREICNCIILYLLARVTTIQ